MRWTVGILLLALLVGCRPEREPEPAAEPARPALESGVRSLAGEDAVHGSAHAHPVEPAAIREFYAHFPERPLPYQFDDESAPRPAREIAPELVQRHLVPASDHATSDRPSRYHAVARLPGTDEWAMIVYLEDLHETRTGGGHVHHLATVSHSSGRLLSRVFFQGFRAAEEGGVRIERWAQHGAIGRDHTITIGRQAYRLEPGAAGMTTEFLENRWYGVDEHGRIRTHRLGQVSPKGELPGQGPNAAQVDIYGPGDIPEWGYRSIAALSVAELTGGTEHVRRHLVELARTIGADGVLIGSVGEAEAGAHEGEAVAIVYLDEQRRWYRR